MLVFHVIDVQDVCNNEAALGRLREAALLVARSLDDLMNHIRRGTTATYEGTQVIYMCSDLQFLSLLYYSLDNKNNNNNNLGNF